jgi:hypothetical protein
LHHTILSRSRAKVNPRAAAAYGEAEERGGSEAYGDWSEPAWCENLCLYRKSVLMLGIVTHEHLRVVRVTQSEKEALEVLGIRFHSEMPFGS